MNRFRCVAVVLLLIASASSQASGNLVDQILHCSQMDTGELRLACYDEMAKGVSSAEKTTDDPPHAQQSVSVAVTAVALPEPATTEPSRQIAEEQFGFEQKQAAAAAEEVDRIYVEVSNVTTDRAGMLTIYLANDQVWKQIGTNRYFYNERQGKAYVERASMNSFFFSQDETNRRIRVKRLR